MNIAAWLILLLPLFSALVIGLGAFRSRKASAAISVGAVTGSFLLTLLLVAAGGKLDPSVTWLAVEGLQIDIGLQIDSLSKLMLCVVTGVGSLIHIFSLGYMKEDRDFSRYFAFLSLFIFSMLGIVLADNFVMMFIFWELVGVSSYLLIGFWFEKPSAADAAKKAFLTNRVGDFGFLIGILMVWAAMGSINFDAIESKLATGTAAITGLAGFLIFCGAMGKSAQAPLHVWLPDAMEGPTPVSALIHAATMVVAGVYLVVRLFPIYNMVPDALDLIAVIGLLTALLAGVMALAMTDLKRILAYSTISHLGFMMLAVGAGFPGVAMFHLLAHAFAKASLFLGAGSISHGTGETDIREMGGLWRKMPFTTVAFWIGALSLAGLPLLSGFFSKDEILLAVHTGRLNDGFLVVTFVAIAFSVLYTGRMLYRVFLGQLLSSNDDAHEPGIRMWAPVGVFALLAAVLGAAAFEWSHNYLGFVSWVTDSEEGFHINAAITGASVVIVVVGLYLTWLIYVQRRISATVISRRLGFVAIAAERKFYFDEVYQWGINQLVLPTARLTAFIDRAWVNDIGVDGPGKTTRWGGGVLRYIQTGMVYNYALGMVIGAVVLGVIWWSV